MAPTSIPHVRLFPIVKNIKDALKKEDNNDNLNYQLEKKFHRGLKKSGRELFLFLSLTLTPLSPILITSSQLKCLAAFEK